MILEIVLFLQQHITTWLFTHSVKVIIILISVFLTYKFSYYGVEKIIRKAVRGGRYLSPASEKKREDTLIRVFTFTIKLLILLLGLLMLLSELGFNTAPLIASAGIAGLAVGFGGQYVIKDIISGFFVILENQYRVGDVVCVGDKCGLVEDINLRLTTLRDLDGTVHHVPNGEVKIASNLSKEKANVNLNIGVAYTTDIEKVEKVINKVGKQLATDKKWSEKILKAPEFLRIDNFADSAIDIKILGETKPLEQWAVTGELRKRLKIAFDKNKIEIPFPHRVVYTPKN